MIMEIVLMNDDAIIPARASKGPAGLDLYSNIDVDIDINSMKKVNTGIRESLSENTYGSIRDKSSLATDGILTLVGVIDNDYAGNYCNNYFFNKTNKNLKRTKKTDKIDKDRIW